MDCHVPAKQPSASSSPAPPLNQTHCERSIRKFRMQRRSERRILISFKRISPLRYSRFPLVGTAGKTVPAKRNLFRRAETLRHCDENFVGCFRLPRAHWSGKGLRQIEIMRSPALADCWSQRRLRWHGRIRYEKAQAGLCRESPLPRESFLEIK